MSYFIHKLICEFIKQKVNKNDKRLVPRYLLELQRTKPGSLSASRVYDTRTSPSELHTKLKQPSLSLRCNCKPDRQRKQSIPVT